MMIWIILTFVLLGLVAAWEEIQQLIQRGSWEWLKDSFWIPMWETDPNVWYKKLFDSHHFAYGLFVLIMFLFSYLHQVEYWWLIPAYWIIFFYVRNLGMHIVFRKKNIEWIYLLPFKLPK